MENQWPKQMVIFEILRRCNPLSCNNMIKSLSCEGFRSFAKKQTLNLAIPNGKRGSGLTVLIGPNGGGKSTLVECFQKISIRNGNVSFTAGKRNKQAGDRVSIEVGFDETSASLSIVEGGGSEAVWTTQNRPRVYFLPARRFFNPYFGRNIWNRSTFIDNPEITRFRASVSDRITVCSNTDYLSLISFSISSMDGSVPLKFSGNNLLSSYSDIPIGCEVDSNAYCARTESLSLQIKRPIVGLSCSPFN